MKKSFTLSNGLRVYLYPQDRALVSMSFCTPSGSAGEPDDLRGAAHYLEHTVLTGTKTYPTQEALNAALGSHSNATTSVTETQYFSVTTADRATRVLSALAEAVLAPLLRDEAVELERGPILDEMRMYEDNAKLALAMDKHFFHGHKAATPIVGTRKSLAGIKAEDLRELHASTHAPADMVLVVVGNITQALLKSIQKLDRYENPRGHTPGERCAVYEGPEQSSVFVVTNKAHTQTSLQMMFASPMMQENRESIVASLAARCLGYSHTSRLYTKLRVKEGLCYGVGAYSYGTSMYGRSGIHTSVEPKNLKRAIAAIWEVIDDAANGITQEELDRAKSDMLVDFSFAMDDISQSVCALADRLVVRVQPDTEATLRRTLKTVKTEDIVDAIQRIYDRDKMIMGVEAPKPIKPSSLRNCL